jgi:predicted transcriptional regulator
MKTIRQVLEDASDTQRASIYRLWNATEEVAGKGKQSVTSLSKRMSNPIAARFVWETLSEDERQILNRVLPHATRMGIIQDTSLIKKTQIDPARFTAAVRSLSEKGLLEAREDPAQRNMYVATKSKKSAKGETVTVLAAISDIAELLYNTSREYFTPSGDHSRWDLDRLLTTLPYNDLNKVLSRYGISHKSSLYYNEGADPMFISDKLLDMDEPLNSLSELDTTARKLFVWLRERGGKESMASARAFLQAESDETLLEAINILSQHALVFDGFVKKEHVLFVPSDWYSNMVSLGSAAKLKKEGGKVTEFEGTPATVVPNEHVTVYDLAMLVNTIYQQTIEPTQAGRVPKRIATKVRTTLRGKPRLDYNGEDDYIEMLLEVLEYYNIVQLATPSFQGTKPAYEIKPSIEHWAKNSLLTQTAFLLAYWLENFKWVDVYGVNYRASNVYSWDATGGRKALLKHLNNCTPGRWYTIDSLLQEIWRDDAFAFRPTSTYARAKQPVKDYDTRVKWERCEGEVYRGILSSTFSEFGLVDVGYADENALRTEKPRNPDYFMVTELGGRILELTRTQGKGFVAEEQDAPSRGLVVQPNFELLLLQPNMSTLYSLLPFTQAKQLGMVSSFTLTKASVTRGLNSGLNIEQIFQTLQERSQNELPQNVDYTVRDWTRTYKSVKLSQVLLFEVSSEDAGKILSVIPALEKMGVRQLAPCIFTVSGDVDIQTLRKELEKASVFVHISGDILTRPKHFYDSFFMPTYGRY